MAFWEELEQNDKKGLFKSDNNTVSYPTGITVLDYANGYWTTVTDENGEEKVIPVIGIQAGSLISIISEVGGGKSTLSTQIGWNIVKPFDDGLLYIVDCEKTVIRRRVANLCRCDYDEPRIKIAKNHTSIEDVLDAFKKVCDLKEASGKKMMYEVKGRSYGEKSFWQYVPTVFIIDSLPSFNSSEYNVDDLGNNIDQMRASKDITRFYTNVLDRAWKYNVIFIVINHIRTNTNMNPYQTPPRGLLMLNPMTESLPRGSVAQFFSTTYFRIRTKKSAAYCEDEDGFNGYKCEISLAKSKSNMVGTSFPVTFNLQKGFDPIYSIYEFANSLGLIKGRNPYLTIDGVDRKFNRKEFVNLMTGDKLFRESVLTVLKPYFEGLLGSKEGLIRSTDEEIEIDLNNISDIGGVIVSDETMNAA